MNLYDTAADVVRKSIVGLGLSPEKLAGLAKISSQDLMSFLNGHFSDDLARRLSPHLGLNTDALCGLPSYHPMVSGLRGVKQVSLPFEDEQVNIWRIEASDTTLVIDCGFRADDLTKSLEPCSDRTNHLLITHTHRDHIGGFNAAATAMLSTLHAPLAFGGCLSIAAGDILEFGPFTVKAVDLAGHHPQALGYRIKGNGLDLIVVGDAVFAGSIGGCPNPDAFALARRTIEAAFSELGPEVVLLPGHGPATTLSSELKANPFLAAWMG